MGRTRGGSHRPDDPGIRFHPSRQNADETASLRTGQGPDRQPDSDPDRQPDSDPDRQSDRKPDSTRDRDPDRKQAPASGTQSPDEKSRDRHARIAEAVFQQATACLAVLDRDQRFVMVNEAYARNFRRRVEEFTGRYFLEVFPNDQQLNPAGFAIFDEVIRTRRPVRVEALPYLFEAQPERRTTYWDWTLEPMLDERGEVELVSFSSVEVTDRVNAMQARVESEQRYRTLVDQASDAIFIADARDRYVDVNEAASKLSGFSREELLGMSIPDLVPPEENPGQRERLRQIHQGATMISERVMRRKDGSALEIEISARQLSDGRFIAMVRDITERRTAEVERAKLAAAVDQASDVVLMTDREGRITYANPAFTAVTGYSTSEAVGHPVHDLLRSAETNPEANVARRRARTHGESWSGRVAGRRADGSPLVVDLVISPIRDRSGTLIGSVDVSRDVTRERALEGQLRQAQKMQAVGRLAGGVAHDFNNLLAAIRGHAELSLAVATPDTPLERSLAEIVRAADRAKLITQRLLTFSRLQPESTAIVDLREVVAGVEPMLDQVVDEKTRLRLQLAPDAVPVRVDQALVEQAVLNLVINARDAMPSGGSIDVRVGLEAVGQTHAAARAGLAPGTYGVLSVADNGEGIAPENLPLLFEPFFTTKPASRGTGLGLAIVYSAVNAAHGTVLVDSNPGQGARFDLLFPLTAPPSERLATIASAGDALVTGSESILVVEDEDAVRSFLGSVLRDHGYDVADVGSAEEALSAAESGPYPSLLITDVLMSRMSGPELAQQLRSRFRGLRVLFVSGYDPDRLAAEGRIERGTTSLAKPFSADDLLRTVRRVLDASVSETSEAR